jgi:hypothetical protein
MESQVEVPGRDTLLMEYAYGSHHESMRLWSDQQQLIQELELTQILEMQGSWEEGEMGSLGMTNCSLATHPLDHLGWPFFSLLSFSV